MKLCIVCNVEKDGTGFANARNKCIQCCTKSNSEWRHRTGRSKKYKGETQKDLIGNQVGHLTVVKNLGVKINNGKSTRFWLCECECGNLVELRNYQITGKRTKSCGCYQYPKGSKNPLWNGCGEISGAQWDRIKRKRRHSDIRPFAITIEEVWQLFLNQGKNVLYLG